MRAVANEVINFEMPGANMANFRKNSTIIAKAGIYDLRLHHDEVVAPILRYWKVFDRTDLGPAASRRARSWRSSWPVSTPRPPVRGEPRSRPRPHGGPGDVAVQV